MQVGVSTFLPEPGSIGRGAGTVGTMHEGDMGYVDTGLVTSMLLGAGHDLPRLMTVHVGQRRGGTLTTMIVREAWQWRLTWPNGTPETLLDTRPQFVTTPTAALLYPDAPRIVTWDQADAMDAVHRAFLADPAPAWATASDLETAVQAVMDGQDPTWQGAALPRPPSVVVIPRSARRDVDAYLRLVAGTLLVVCALVPVVLAIIHWLGG